MANAADAILRADATALNAAIEEFNGWLDSADKLPLDVALEFQDIFADCTKAVAVHSKFDRAMGTGDVAVVFEPSQRFLDLLVALRARNALRGLLW